MPPKPVLCRGVLSSLKEVNEKPIGGRTGFSLESESSNDDIGIGGGDVSSFGRPCCDYTIGSIAIGPALLIIRAPTTQVVRITTTMARPMMVATAAVLMGHLMRVSKRRWRMLSLLCQQAEE